MRWRREQLQLDNTSNDSSVDETYALLQTTYWSHKRPREGVARLLETSLCFFLRAGTEQVGFARVITDYATTSWLADVIIADQHRASGVGTWMMQCVMEHPEICETQFILQTGTAHKFYERLGFAQNEALMSTAVDYL